MVKYRLIAGHVGVVGVGFGPLRRNLIHLDVVGIISNWLRLNVLGFVIVRILYRNFTFTFNFALLVVLRKWGLSLHKSLAALRLYQRRIGPLILNLLLRWRSKCSNRRFCSRVSCLDTSFLLRILFGLLLALVPYLLQFPILLLPFLHKGIQDANAKLIELASGIIVILHWGVTKPLSGGFNGLK